MRDLVRSQVESEKAVEVADIAVKMKAAHEKSKRLRDQAKY